MAKETVIGKREPIGHHGKPLHGGTPVQDATKIMCRVAQRSMVSISDKDTGTIGDYAFPRLSTFH